MRPQRKKIYWYALLLFMLLCVLLPGSDSSALANSEKGTKSNPAIRKKPAYRFGIDLNAAMVNYGVVKPGQTLTEILKQYKVPYTVILEAVAKSNGVFDVRKLRAGTSYCIVGNRDADKTVRFFVYELSLINYVVFDLGDPVKVYRGTTTMQTKIRSASGVITSSLWDAFSKQRLDYRLAFGLSELYAWTIDFHRLRKDDRFKVIFEEKYVGGKPARIGAIKASKFTHAGQDFYAFNFEQDGGDRYFDENGNSLQKTFLSAPIKYGRVSSGFSGKRFHPVLNDYRKHLGLDYTAPAGTPVMTVGDGVIIEAGFSRTAGKFVKVRHSGAFKSQYLHLSGFAAGIKPGTIVKQGDTIGYVGRTGLATGPHLDLRFWENSRPVDFSKVDLPAGAPVKKECLNLFNRLVAELKPRLDLDGDPVALVPGDTGKAGS